MSAPKLRRDYRCNLCDRPLLLSEVGPHYRIAHPDDPPDITNLANGQRLVVPVAPPEAPTQSGEPPHKPPDRPTAFGGDGPKPGNGRYPCTCCQHYAALAISGYVGDDLIHWLDCPVCDGGAYTPT